ncbi:MAG: class I SAM-dependent methyltransferase [Dokdonia sp.]|jgi:2-polyprenyl-3-methyl-5-hydroxy-6-metoxy-1,4-benzoquinol methylase
MKSSFSVTDHAVSGERFELVYNEQRHMYETSPVPAPDKISAYYESEDYISHTDAKRSLFEMLYYGVKQITLSRKQKLIKTYSPEKGKILDLGAGTGDFLEFCKNKSWETLGVEPSEAARKLAAAKGLDLLKDQKQITTTFNVITMWHVLEHVHDVHAQMKWLKEHLHQNGTLFIAVPNFESYDAQHYGSFWAGYDVPRHLHHFSEKAIRWYCDQNQLQLLDTRPMKFDAYYVSLLSEKYKNGRMRYWPAFITAWRSNQKAKRSRAYSSKIYIIKHKS